MSIGDAEIKTQERVIRFFKDPEILGYQYIGNLSDYQNKNIKEDRLRQYLRKPGIFRVEFMMLIRLCTHG